MNKIKNTNRKLTQYGWIDDNDKATILKEIAKEKAKEVIDLGR